MNIVMNTEWKQYVPDAVYRVISDVNGVHRIKVLFETQREGTGVDRQYPDIK